MMESFEIDHYARAIFLELPPSGVVLLQAVIESYENLGVVRTINPQKGVISVVTTSAGVSIVWDILHELAPLIDWRPIVEVTDEMRRDVIPNYSEQPGICQC